MGVVIRSTHKDVRSSVAVDPNEFWSKMATNWGGFPVTFTNADTGKLTTVKATVLTPAPFTTIINLIGSGLEVTVEKIGSEI